MSETCKTVTIRTTTYHGQRIVVNERTIRVPVAARPTKSTRKGKSCQPK